MSGVAPAFPFAGAAVAPLRVKAEREGSGNAIHLPMSRQDVADYLGLTIETISRTLTQRQPAVCDRSESRRPSGRDH